MVRLSRRHLAAAVALTLAASGHAFAGGTETAAAGAGNSFLTAGFAAPVFARGAQVAAIPGSAVTLEGVRSMLGRALGGSTLPSPLALSVLAQVAPGAKAATKEITLSPLLNRHFKTTLTFSMGGKSVWISGSFDRGQKAYVSVLEDGKAAKFFNVEDLLTHPAMLDIGSAKVKLSLSPDLSDQLESEIVLTNAANRKDQQRITLRDMLAAVSAAGESVAIGGQAYKLFYYDDIKDGVGNPASKSFAFILTDAKGEISVFLVPSELVPADKIAIFKMADNKSVGLQQKDGALRLFDNP